MHHSIKKTRSSITATRFHSDNLLSGDYDNAITRYITDVTVMSKSTAYEYLRRLNNFKLFVDAKYDYTTLDSLIVKIKEGTEDVYSLLSRYAAYLTENNIKTLTLKQRIITAKNFLEYHDVDISPRKFKLKVKLPRDVRKNKEALSKEDVTKILNACSDIRLKTYVMLLAATGMRAQEALSIRFKDIEMEQKSIPARVLVRGEYTKTRTDRIVFLTNELAQQLKLWLDYKYRTRRVSHKLHVNAITKTTTETRTPSRVDTDLVFAVHQSKNVPNTLYLYYDLVRSFATTLDRMGKGAREDSNRRRQITLHSFRRFVKTTISDLGYADYSEYFIGHSGSTYWRKKESEKAEIFRKIEPYLTFLNVHQLERQGADIQSKVEELEELNQSLRQRDKVKDDAIAQLSDQLVALSTRIQEIEKKQYR